jgi:formiminotetrahydrofolate cyclodeaminase
MSSQKLPAEDRIKLRSGAVQTAQGHSKHQNDALVPFSRVVQKISERDDSFLNRITVDLLELFAAGKPTPGAGSAAALIGALSGSLAQSVAQYTIKAAKNSKRRDDYVPFQERAEEILDEARSRSHHLRNAVDEDSVAYDQYRSHWRLQEAYIEGATEAEKADLQARTSESLKRATDIPIEIAEGCIALAEMGLELYGRGYRDARGETCTAVLTAIASGEAAMHTASLNLQSARVAVWMDSRRDKIRVLRRRLRDLRKLIESRIYGEGELV